MTTSHSAAVAVAASFLKQDAPTEEDVELFYAKIFPGLPEGQREIIFDWLLSSVDDVTPEDVARLMKTLLTRADFKAPSEGPSASDSLPAVETSAYAHRM